MEKKDIKFIIAFILIFVLCVGYLFQSTYAKYRKQIDTSVDANIAGWNIKINNEDIKGKKTLTNKIVPVLENSEYVKENTIAPGTKGYFDITLDTSKVDVDFNYEISYSLSEQTSLKDFKVTQYEINDSGTKIDYQDNITSSLQKNTQNTKIRLYIEWIDDESNEMNNEEDTSYAANYSKAIIDVKIKLTQKLS